MSTFRLLIATAAVSLSASALLAQEPEATEARHGPTTKLQSALQKMLELPSMRFSTRLDGAKPAAKNPAGMAGVVRLGGPFGGLDDQRNLDKVQGVWTPGLLTATHDDTTMAFAHNRMAIEGKSGWLLRDGCDAEGNAVPMVVDPSTWLTVLSTLDLEVVHSDVGTHNDRPVQMLTVTLDKEQVTELDLAGLLPDAPPDAAGGGNGQMVFRAVQVNLQGVVNGKPMVPERMLDLVFYIDPATNLIHQVRARQHEQAFDGLLGGQIIINGIGQNGGGDTDEEEEDDEAEAPESDDSRPQFKDGFPVLSKAARKKLHHFDYSIEFADHGTATVPELPAAARRLLGLR